MIPLSLSSFHQVDRSVGGSVGVGGRVRGGAVIAGERDGGGGREHAQAGGGGALGKAMPESIPTPSRYHTYAQHPPTHTHTHTLIQALDALHFGTVPGTHTHTRPHPHGHPHPHPYQHTHPCPTRQHNPCLPPGGAQFYAGKGLDNANYAAAIAGAVSGAYHVRAMAEQVFVCACVCVGYMHTPAQPSRAQVHIRARTLFLN